MVRKSNGGASTATAERKRKTPTQKAESMTVRIINALRKLACVELSASHREQIDQAIDREKIAMKQAWDAMDDDPSDDEPDTFKLS